MASIDEIEELRAELRYSHLTVAERRSAEVRLAELRRSRNVELLVSIQATAQR